MPTRAALYVRVSTAKKAARANEETGERAYEQNPGLQQEALEQVCARKGWEVHRVYVDRVSSTKENRPGLAQMWKDVRGGRAGAVVVWRFDRFARTVRELVMALDEFKALRVEFISYREQLDTSTPMGKAMFGMVAVMAELERDILRERVVAGMNYAAEHGTKSGRPSGRPKRVFDRMRALVLHGEKGLPWPEVARTMGVSESTLRRGLRK